MKRALKPLWSHEDCPSFQDHTPGQPYGYVNWHEWAQKMSRTHKQIRCTGCGLYSIWVPRAKRTELTADLLNGER